MPKLFKTSGGTGGETRHEVYAHVPAEVGTVLAFYRRELAARHWKEETQGAVVTPQAVTLNFTAPEGPAVLKLGHKYDLTTVSLVLHLPKPVAKAEPAAKADSLNSMMKDMQQMVREATAAAKTGMNPPQAAPAPKTPEPALRAASGKQGAGPRAGQCGRRRIRRRRRPARVQQRLEPQGGRRFLSLGDESAGMEFAILGHQQRQHGRAQLLQGGQDRLVHHHADGQQDQRGGEWPGAAGRGGR